MDKQYTLITGATGFIGSHVAARLLLESYPLVAIVRKTANYKNVNNLRQDGAVLIEGRFYDKELLENLFANFPIENIIHVAALRGGGMGTGEDYQKINVLGTETLLQVSLQHRVRRFVYISSVGVTGTIPGDLPGNTASKYHGDNLYHESKVLAEKKVHEFIQKGLDAYILRPAITYGIGDDGFPRTLVKLIKRRMLLLPMEDIEIHLLDVNTMADLVITTMRSVQLHQKVFIAADAIPISLRALANKIYKHYYQREYPSFLKLPNNVFKALLYCLLFFHSEKWVTRIRLISNNWYYDINPTIMNLSFKPADTSESFVRNMCN